MAALHDRGCEHGDTDAPTITVAEPLNADVWFDLVTKHMVNGRGLRNVQYLIPLPAKQQLDEGEARKAFHDNFRDYLRIARNDKKADQWSLYSILDVHGGRYSFVQIGGSERLTLQGAPKLEPHLQILDHDTRGRGRRLMEAMSVELRKLHHVAPSQAAFADFARMFSHCDWKRWFSPDGHFDLGAWFQSETPASADHTIPFFGYPYVERNRTAIAGLMETSLLDLDGEDLMQLWWLRPGSTMWGATEDVPATLETLRAAVHARSKTATLSSLLLSPASVGEQQARNYTRVFDRGVRAPVGKVPLALEVLLVPERLAVVCAMVALSDSVHVPIGYATINAATVQGVLEATGLEKLIREGMRQWPQHAQ